MRGKVLIIAGSDSGGGAGIQADIKTVSALGGYAATAITAVTAQNTLGVFGVHSIPERTVAQQIELVLDDIGADAIKIGMLHNSLLIETIAYMLEQKARHIPLILDPVMVAKGGHPLLEPDAVETLKVRLLPMASILTPNIPEAELLCGFAIHSLDDMRRAAATLRDLGARAVLVKGGHMEGHTVQDVWLGGGIEFIFEQPRIETKNTHGTGCTLASAIAAGIAQGLPESEAVHRARHYVVEAIRHAPAIGKGHGPLDHFWMHS